MTHYQDFDAPTPDFNDARQIKKQWVEFESNATNLERQLVKLQERYPDFPLVPIGENKRPIGLNWQNTPYTPEQFLQAFQAGGFDTGYGQKVQPKGFGIITGSPISIGGKVYYGLAIDQDGKSAGEKIIELTNGEGLPLTVAFTSGREGRCQFLFLVPEEYHDQIATKKIKCGKDSDGKDELLEFRYKNCQSVLPPSVHPTTGFYKWVEGCSIDDQDIAIIPDWVLDFIKRDEVKPTCLDHQSSEVSKTKTESNLSAIAKHDFNGSLFHEQTKTSYHGHWTEIDWAVCYLDALHPSRADNYEEWVNVGMALHSVSPSLFTEWDRWSQQSPKYNANECHKKWRSFGKGSGLTIGSLHYWAKEDGWQFPSNGFSYTDPDTGVHVFKEATNKQIIPKRLILAPLYSLPMEVLEDAPTPNNISFDCSIPIELKTFLPPGANPTQRLAVAKYRGKVAQDLGITVTGTLLELAALLANQMGKDPQKYGLAWVAIAKNIKYKESQTETILTYIKTTNQAGELSDQEILESFSNEGDYLKQIADYHKLRSIHGILPNDTVVGIQEKPEDWLKNNIPLIREHNQILLLWERCINRHIGGLLKKVKAYNTMLLAHDATNLEQPLRDRIKHACSLKQLIEVKDLKTYTASLSVDGVYNEEKQKYYLDYQRVGNENLAVGAPMGSGKSQLAGREIKKNWIDNDKGSFAVIHRISIGEDLAKNALNLPYRTSLLGGYDKRGFVLCLHSMLLNGNPPFYTPHHYNKNLYIDEARANVLTLLFEKTLSGKRLEIANNLADYLKNCNEYDSHATIMDANLDDLTVRFYEDLGGIKFKKIKQVLRHKKKQKVTIFKNRDVFFSKFINRVLAGKKLMLATGAQKTSSKNSTQTIEELLLTEFKKHNISNKVLRIDRETVSDKDHEAYKIFDNITEEIHLYHVSIVSPVMESAVSIQEPSTGELYEEIWAYFSGVQTPESCSQFISRIRYDLPVFCYIAPRGLFLQSIGIPDHGELKKALDTTRKEIEAEYELLRNIDEDNLEVRLIMERYLISFTALLNWQCEHYFDAVLEELELNYDFIIFFDKLDDIEEIYTAKEVKALKTEARERLYDGECARVASSPNPDDKTYQLLLKSPFLKQEEREKLKKGSVVRGFGLQPEKTLPEYVKAYDEGLHRALKRRYFATDEGFKYAKEVSFDAAYQYLDQSKGNAWTPDLERRWEYERIKLVRKLGLLEPDKDNLDKWWACIVTHKLDITRLFGVTVKPKPDSQKAWLRNMAELLKLVGKVIKSDFQGNLAINDIDPELTLIALQHHRQSIETRTNKKPMDERKAREGFEALMEICAHFGFFPNQDFWNFVKRNPFPSRGERIYRKIAGMDDSLLGTSTYYTFVNNLGLMTRSTMFESWQTEKQKDFLPKVNPTPLKGSEFENSLIDNKTCFHNGVNTLQTTNSQEDIAKMLIDCNEVQVLEDLLACKFDEKDFQGALNLLPTEVKNKINKWLTVILGNQKREAGSPQVLKENSQTKRIEEVENKPLSDPTEQKPEIIIETNLQTVLDQTTLEELNKNPKNWLLSNVVKLDQILENTAYLEKPLTKEKMYIGARVRVIEDDKGWIYCTGTITKHDSFGRWWLHLDAFQEVGNLEKICYKPNQLCFVEAEDISKYQDVPNPKIEEDLTTRNWLITLVFLLIVALRQYKYVISCLAPLGLPQLVRCSSGFFLS